MDLRLPDVNSIVSVRPSVDLRAGAHAEGCEAGSELQFV